MPLPILPSMQLHCELVKATIEARQCYGKMAEKTDLEMRAQWTLTLEAVRRQDEENRRDQANRPVMLGTLRESQDAWLRYREAECDMVGDSFAGGTDYGKIVSLCEIELNRKRIEQLYRRANGQAVPSYPEP